MDGPDALEQSCARLERLAANAEITIRELRVRAALRLATVVGMTMTALLGCVVALALTWDGPYRLTTAILLWGAFAIGTLYLRARLEREKRTATARSFARAASALARGVSGREAGGQVVDRSSP